MSAIKKRINTVQELASFASQFMVTFERDNDDTVYYKWSSNVPSFIKDTLTPTLRDTPGQIDYNYRFLSSALSDIANYDDIYDAIKDIQPDVYNYDLTAWLHANHDHREYVNESREEGITFETIESELMFAQSRHIEAIYFSAHQALTELFEELDEDFLVVCHDNEWNIHEKFDYSGISTGLHLLGKAVRVRELLKTENIIAFEVKRNWQAITITFKNGSKFFISAIQHKTLLSDVCKAIAQTSPVYDSLSDFCFIEFRDYPRLTDILDKATSITTERWKDASGRERLTTTYEINTDSGTYALPLHLANEAEQKIFDQYLARFTKRNTLNLVIWE